jgi:DNA primase
VSIPREFIDLLLAKIDIVDLINTHVPLKKKSNSNYFARCPFHNEKSASFSVSQPKQFYYCFGCGAHGNAVDFLMNQDRLSFPEAVEALARTAGLEVPHDGTHPVKKDESLTVLYDLMATVADYYYEQLKLSPRAITYLKNRGITGDIAKLFSLGYAQSGWSHLLDAHGTNEIDRKKLFDTGLIIKKEEGGHYDRFRDRIMFPIRDHRGRFIGFGGRVLDQGEPKYLNSPETPLFQKGHELYGLYQTLKANRKVERLMVVEGYMDVIALFQSGVTYAVATLGTATTAHHLQRLLRYTSEIIFCFDGDQAGRTAAWRALEVTLPIMNDSMQVRFLFLPDGDDPDSLIRKEGKAAFEQRIQTAMPLSDFFFQTMAKQADVATMEGRARFAAAALNHIKQVPAGIYHDILLRELEKRARIELDHIPASTAKPTESDQPSYNASDDNKLKAKLPPPIRLALTLLVQHPHLASLAQELPPPTSLPGLAFMLQLVDIIKQNLKITTGALLEYWRGQKEEGFVAKLAHWEHAVPEPGIEHEFLGILRQINILAYDNEINRLLAKAAQDGLSNDEKTELTTWIGRKKAYT